jgi:hypothetical protein
MYYTMTTTKIIPLKNSGNKETGYIPKAREHCFTIVCDLRPGIMSLLKPDVSDQSKNLLA